MKIVVMGANGQLGNSLRDCAPADVAVTYLTRQDCDLTSPEAINASLDAAEPDVMINAAAYTAVDLAESEAALAAKINVEAVAVMASWAQANNAQLVHFSTDFVFDGSSTRPYQIEDPTSALGVYGATKREGELAALAAAPANVMIIRTSWVYSEHGQNFVKTMLRLMGERDQLSVVDDQRGCPTYAGNLAELTWHLVTQKLFTPGIYHWSDAGIATWYEFAQEIGRQAHQAGLLAREIPIAPITTDQYPTPASRPAYSVLDTTKLATLAGRQPAPWQDRLQTMLTRLPRP